MTPDEAPETPDTPATPEADTDWHARYQSLQPEYTRTTQALKDRESAWEDDTAVLSRLQELRPDLFEDEDDDTPADDYDDPVAPIRSELDEFKKWQMQVENERGEERFSRDLKAELGDDTVPGKVVDWIKDRTRALGNEPKALKQAVEEYREFSKELTGQHLESVTKSKRTTSTPPTGKAGTEVPNLDDRAAREQYMRQRVREIEAANQR